MVSLLHDAEFFVDNLDAPSAILARPKCLSVVGVLHILGVGYEPKV